MKQRIRTLMYLIGCILTTNKRADLKEQERGPGQCRDPAPRPLGTLSENDLETLR